MWKNLRVLLIVMILPAALPAQSALSGSDTAARASEALSLARSGKTEGALEIYKDLVASEPGNMPLLRDYAVVLGWAEKYQEAIPVARKVRQMAPDQPDWALRDFAGIFLFGDALPDALKTLNELVDRGDTTEQTLLRRALTLRWMGNADDAELAYRQAASRHPSSGDAVAGLAYALADKGKLSEAWTRLENTPSATRNTVPVLRARIRILNWMGRHFEAQRLIAQLPEDLLEDKAILEDRIAAARWGGDPSGAVRQADRLVTLFPTDATWKVSRDLRTEYGHVASSGFRLSSDVDGLVDRALSQEAAFHLTPAHAIRAGYQYRWLELAGEQRTLVRYETGWSGNLGSRLSMYATLAGIDYRVTGVDRKLIGDGSAEVTINDTLRVTAGGGSLVMDAFQSLDNQVTAPFGFAHLALTPNARNRFQARYGRYTFSNDVVRDRTDFEYMRTLLAESGVRVKAGWRSNLMWHDVGTSDFYSPSAFQSHMAVLESQGPITRWMEYTGELAAGWQLESGAPTLHPLQFSGSVVLHPNRHWRTILSAGRSTSSVDRVVPGQYVYSRWTAGVGMEFRFP
jgi:tetratricopeptide (TPR) repeat protein